MRVGSSLPVVALKRRSPREYLVVASLNRSAAAKDSGKGQSPETAARRSGPRIRPLGAAARETVRGSIAGRKAFDTLREEKTPKGQEPHERCRDETSPDRPRRE
jgi:hypothetical protein